ncbi:14344_t:CDS:2 [Entrophospora sp. SA101]|nr:14344_t:CDS:2 [Entrophospora sp. SA101]CAJ0886694.1 11718_t:CDS:2 [Entrophospora sp. SA101]
MSATPFMEFLSSGIWTALADKYNYHKKILLICSCSAASFIMSMPLIGQNFGFRGLFVLFLIYASFSGGIAPLIDNLSIGILKNQGKQSEYGRQRLWGTIACGVISSMFGILIDLTTIYIIFFGYLFFISFHILIIIKTNDSQFNFNQQYDHQSIPLDDLDDNYHYSKTILGLSQVTSVSLEIVVFYYAKQLLDSVGPKYMMITGQLASIIRVGLYGFLSTQLKPWMALPIEMLQGALYSLVWTSGVEITINLAPKELQATYLGLCSGIFYCLASGIGSILGGLIYSGSSPERMFQCMTLLSIIALVLYISGEKILSSGNKKLDHHDDHVLLLNQSRKSEEFLDDDDIV